MRSLSTLACLLLLSLPMLVACEDPPPPAEPEEEPIVGMGEVAISLHHADPAPSGALHIEISQTELQLEHHSVYTLDDGRPPAAEVTPNGYTLLATRIAAAPSRSAASITAMGAVPYGTVVRTIQTLLNANYRTIHFAVREPNASPPAWGWMTLESPRVVPHEGDVTFPGVTTPWSAFTDHWREVYDECNAGRFVDCEGPASLAAEGGELQLRTFIRGGMLGLTFDQMNAPDAGPVPTGGPRMLDGVRAPGGDDEEEPPPMPDAEARFDWRFEEAANPESHIPLAVRPVCGSNTCPIVIEADDETQVMRVLSFLGAIWPDGASPPAVAFRLPE
jgi:hypothetical protein